MIPVLFPSNETAFTSNGLGRLTDARACEVTEERNGQYELYMEYPTNGALINYLVHGNYILATHDNNGDAQPFCIYSTEESLDGFIVVRAWHLSYMLNNVILKPFTAGSITETIAAIPNKSINNNPFTFWTDKQVTSDFELAVPKSVRAVLGGSEGSILDVYGKGEYEFDLFTVRLYLNRGQDRGVTIRYGKNLVSLDRELDASTVFNAVVPFWANEDVTVSLDHTVVKTGQTEGRAIALDLSDKWDEAPTTSQLEAAAQAYVDGSDNYQIRENLKIDFVQLWQTSEYQNVANLQRVSLCDTVHVIYRGITATAKCIKVVYDTLRERYSSMELGEPRTSLAQQIDKEVVQPALAGVPSKSTIMSAIDRATAMIGGGFGGYIKYKYLSNGTPSEQLIMDSPDEATATNIIRLNKNGIGFSTDGGATYRNAWTIDGQLNADFITTGNLIASVITTGLLQDATGKNYWNLETGEMVVSANGTFGGELRAATGTFAGALQAATGSFSGQIQGGSISIGGTASAPIFAVGTDGKVTMKNFDLDGTGNAATIGCFTFNAENLRAGTAVIEGDLHMNGGEIHAGDISSGGTVGCNTVSCNTIYCTNPPWSVYDPYDDSDRRLKRDITDIDGTAALAFILALNPKKYTLKKDEREALGFIAQDIKDTMKRLNVSYPLIKEREDGMLALNYQNLLALIVSAIQQLAR